VVSDSPFTMRDPRALIQGLLQGRRPVRECPVTMLGPSRVGKTSLLVSMYQQFQTVGGESDLQLIPDDAAKIELNDKLDELRGLVSGPIPGVGLTQTDEPRRFHFGLGRVGSPPAIDLSFHDFPGAFVYHAQKDLAVRKAQLHELKEMVQSSSVSLLAVDAPAIMESGGRYHEVINRPERVTEIVRDAYSNGGGEPRLLIISPVKCEKYVRTSELQAQLYAGVESAYGKLLEFLRSEAVRKRVAIVFAPVQTVGSLSFSHFARSPDGTPEHRFKWTDEADTGYRPQDGDQPLRYLVRFLLAREYERARGNNSTTIGSLVNRWRDFWGMDDELRTAARHYAAGCKTGNGFKILQGIELLSLG